MYVLLSSPPKFEGIFTLERLTSEWWIWGDEKMIVVLFGLRGFKK